jgi:replicative DNA helicase
VSEPRFQAVGDILDDWRDDVLSGKPPTLHRIGEGFDGIEIGPGLVTLIGGAPGAGKTALTLQWTFDALTLNPELRAMIANVEMTSSTILDRQLARLSGVDLTTIRHRRLTAAHGDAIAKGMEAIDALARRLTFLSPPFDLRNLATSADAHGADLIVLDYVQRFGAVGSHNDHRGAVSESMSFIRQFAGAGVAILVVAALARSKDRSGRSSYTGLSLASFRETSELEYGADDAFILAPDGELGSSPSLSLAEALEEPARRDSGHTAVVRSAPSAIHGQTRPEAEAAEAGWQVNHRDCCPLGSHAACTRRRRRGGRGPVMSNYTKRTARRRTTKRRSRLRFEILNAFVDDGIVKAGLTAHQALVWLVLYRDTRQNGFATTSVGDIARRAGIGRRTVLRALAQLKRARMLRVARRGGPNRGASSYAVFPVPME